MDNCEFKVDDYIDSIKNNDEYSIIYNACAIEHHLNILSKSLLLLYNYEKLARVAYILKPNKLSYNVSNINILLLKKKIKIIIWLLNNINYLYNIEDDEKAISLINIYHYLVLLDFERIDFLDINSNKGRKVLASYMLNTIDNYFDKIIFNIHIYDDSKDLKKVLKNGK